MHALIGALGAEGAGESWLRNLITAQSVAHSVLILSLVAAVGLTLGAVRVWGIGLGIAGVLFAGLGFGHFGFTIDHEVLEFTREFGLILFVYTIGMQVGPGFVSSLRKAGLPLNLMAASIVVLGVVVTLAVVEVSKRMGRAIEMPVAVGLMSGGTTNTPSLAAAQDSIKEVLRGGSQQVAATNGGAGAATTRAGEAGNNVGEADAEGAAGEVLKLPGLGYAVAYPFGIVGTILTMLLIKKVFRVDTGRENELFGKLNLKGGAGALETVNLEVSNPNLEGRKLGEIPQLREGGVVISRVLEKGVAKVAKGELVLRMGDVLLAVGTRERLDALTLLVGKESAVDVTKVSAGAITTRRLVVTQRSVIGKTIEELPAFNQFGVTATRVSRADVEIAATAGWRFQFGDVVQVVGEPGAIKEVGAAVGDSVRRLDYPHIIPMFLGIALGVTLGMMPIAFPGVPAPVRLGLAGGPLLVAIILSRVGQIGPLTWYMPRSSNLALRELGIVLFLACVGLKAGDRFVQTLVEGDGFLWMGMAAMITLLPLLLVGLAARVWMKMNYVSICGLLAGSMTDPPALQFANQMTAGEGPSVAYATVYPLTMLLRVVAAQVLVLVFWRA